MAVIVPYGGEYKGDTAIEIAGGHILIGRSIECDLILKGRDVTAHHAEIVSRNKVWWLRDLGSVNGTILRKKPVVQEKLAYDDEFFIGPYRIVFADTAASLAEKAEATIGEIRRMLHARLIDELDLKKLKLEQIIDPAFRRRASEVLDRLIREKEREIPPQFSRDELSKAVLDAALGLGPLEDMLADDEITEIMVNGPQNIFVEKNGKLQKSPKFFLSDAEIETAIGRIVSEVNKAINQQTPTVDARLKDGSRVHAIIPPLALDGPTVTIRKFPKKRIKIEDLVGFGSMNKSMADLLSVSVLAAKNIVISGGTGSGKTTLLNALSAFVPDHERIITIEDAAELRLAQAHVVRLETRPANIEGEGEVTIRDLVRNALRMRPNRIVVGECRGGEALDMLQAMNTGHDGSLTTLHANTPHDAVSRLENMVLQASRDLPLRAVRAMIFSAVRLIIQISRLSDHSRKVTSIAELVALHDGEIRLQEIFQFRKVGVDEDGKVIGFHTATGVIPLFVDELRAAGKRVDMSMFVPTIKD